MKELDLMRALEGVDDNILLEAERLEHRPRRRLLPRIAAVAAVIALLCGSVYAAVMSVKVDITDRTWVYHYEERREDVLYTKIEAEYEMTEQEIPKKAMEFVTGYLDAHLQESLNGPSFPGAIHVGMVARGPSYVAGSHWWEENGEYLRPDGLDSHYFQSVEEAEEFFGMTFALPECVRTTPLSSLSVADDPGILLEILSPPLAEPDQVLAYLEGLTEAEALEQIVPGYAELSFRVEDPTPELAVISGQVVFALNEDAALGGYTYEVSVPLELLGEPSYPALDIDGLDGTLVVFPPCATDPGSASAYYTSNGVAYILHAYAAEDVVIEDPAQLLLPWLEQLG